MKTQTHTPGPWKLSAETMLNSTSKRVVTADNKFVLKIEGADFGRDEDSANARLIAAAPELLSALSNILEDHKRMFPEAHPNSTIAWEECEEVKAALSAIAKAEGRAE